MDQPKNEKGEACFHGSCVPKKAKPENKNPCRYVANEDDFL